MATTTNPSPKRIETLNCARELGATDEVLEVLAHATYVGRNSTIVLPARYSHLSRARGWARAGGGGSVAWGARDGDGYRVGAGQWTVCSSDGFKREERKVWDVRHVQVGDQTWCVAAERK